MRSIFRNILGLVVLTILWVNTLFWCTPLIIVSIFKFILPIPEWTKNINKLLIFFGQSWISVNSWLVENISGVQIDTNAFDNLNYQSSYMVVANHQSYADIIILQKIFNHRIPFLKFFLKKQLFWVPFLGLAWWALDFPFMQRHSKEYLKKHPEEAGKDLIATKKACEKFKTMPVAVMNFTEGTRFRVEKKAKQHSPYVNLLKPKAGGLGYVLTILDEQIEKVVDVSISYSGKTPGIIGFLGGKLKNIPVKVRVLDIPQPVKNNYIENKECRVATQQWLNVIWQEKDLWLQQHLKTNL